MFCPNCGAEIEDDAVFCSDCGTRLQDMENAGPDVADQTVNTAEETDGVYADGGRKKRGKKRKAPVIILILVPIAAAAAAVVLLIMKGLITLPGKLGSTSKLNRNNYITAAVDEDGKAYIPTMDGKTIEISGDIQKAAMTPDRKRIVVLQENGTLYITDSGQKDKNKIARDVQGFGIVQDEGFCYADEDGKTHRYLFKDESDVNLGEISRSKCSDINFHIAYVNDKGVYLLSGDSDEKVKLGNYKGSCSILAVNDDGRTVYWEDVLAEGNKHETNVYKNVGEEKTKIGTFTTGENYYSSTFVTQNLDQSYAVIYKPDTEGIYIVSGEDAVKVKLTPQYGIYTENTAVAIDSADSFSELYTLTADGELYCIDPEGEKEEILSDVTDFGIEDHILYYLDTDEQLRRAEVSGTEITNDEKIAKNVSGILNHLNGYVYFYKAEDSEDGADLYVYKEGKNQLHIASDVYTNYTRYTEDQKTIFYLKDYDSDTMAGKLYSYSYGDKEDQKIASEVRYGSFYSSGIRYIDEHSLIYRKYQYEEDGTTVYDWYYYNGRKSDKFAKEVHFN